ncbi:hypothetical protein LSAT2_029912 [Lamellibrachia satsuma]|nr:hypothetical protein LSAT2_029912 [Lamellibrachia satsuma]
MTSTNKEQTTISSHLKEQTTISTPVVDKRRCDSAKEEVVSRRPSDRSPQRLPERQVDAERQGPDIGADKKTGKPRGKLVRFDYCVQGQSSQRPKLKRAGTPYWAAEETLTAIDAGDETDTV